MYAISVKGSHGETVYFESGNPPRTGFNYVKTIERAKKWSSKASALRVFDALLEWGLRPTLHWLERNP